MADALTLEARRNRHRTQQRLVCVELEAGAAGDLAVAAGQQIPGQVLARTVQRQLVLLEQGCDGRPVVLGGRPQFDARVHSASPAATRGPSSKRTRT